MFTKAPNTKPNTANREEQGSFIQPKLKIGKANDPYEKEADAMADKVVEKSNEPASDAAPTFFSPAKSVQKKEEEQVQEKPLADQITPVVQLKEEEIQQKEEEEIQEKEEEDMVQRASGSGDDGGASNIEQNLAASKGGGSPMDTGTKNQMESGFGADFSGVRIHNDSNAVQMNQELGSQAFANGNDIYFNEGKYNPGSSDGQHLLAHELTHTVQQGASPASDSVQKADNATPPTAVLPTTVLDISRGLTMSDDWLAYMEANPRKSTFDVQVKIGSQFSGTIKIKKKGRPKEGEKQKFELKSTRKNNHLDVQGMTFLNPLRDKGLVPILVLRSFGDEQVTSGFLSIRKGEEAFTKDIAQIIKSINETKESMGFLGLSDINLPEGLENSYVNGGLNFKANNIAVGVDGYIEATGSIGITNSALTFDVTANVEVAGLAQGEFNLKRGPEGKLSGKATIAADIANVNASLTIEYDKGAVLIQGTGKIQSEKFSGSVTLLVTDAAKAKEMRNSALGVETAGDAQAAPAGDAKAVTKSKENQVLSGWGEVSATITPWLEGTAKVGIDEKGHITIVGEIVVPDEIELMEQRGKKVDIFNVELRAGYGIPLVGQVFLFAGIGMFVNAGFGPLVLKNVGFTGTYSTDPDVLQQFSITGTLGINAFAIIGLEAEAGVGVTILGHDVKAGVNVTAAAGIKAYAEATPTFEYKEQKGPAGGKVGESRLKGHFEAAAQLFLQLSGALFYELDSPWWSPAPDGREEYPLGEVQYPIGDSMGIGADMDWLVGSNEVPELKFSPVEFDPDKFTADVMADPPPKKRGKSDANPEGKWKGEPKPDGKTDEPKTKDGKGLPENGKKKEDLKKLPDQQKYMRALDEMAKLEKSEPKPTYKVVEAKAKKVKAKYGLDLIQLKNKADDSVSVYVKHKKDNNGKHMVKIPLMSPAERKKLVGTALGDLRTRSQKAADKTGKLNKDTAQTTANGWKTAHPVVEGVSIVDGGKTWDFEVDLGDKTEKIPGKLKLEGQANKLSDTEVGEEVSFSADGEGHRLWIATKGKTFELMVASTPIAVKGRLDKWKIALKKKKKAEQTKMKPSLDKGFDLYKDIIKFAKIAGDIMNLDPTKLTAEKVAEAKAADDKVEASQHQIKGVMISLFEFFGDDNDIISTFSGNFDKMHPEVKIFMMDTIEKKPEEFTTIATNWEAIVAKVKTLNTKVSLSYEHPMTKAHTYGQYIQKNPASRALEAVLKESRKSEENKAAIRANMLIWIDDRAGSVKNSLTKESGDVKEKLVDQIEDKSKEPASFTSLKAYFKASLKTGSAEHKRFKPKETQPPKTVGDMTTIYYGYEGGREKFEVTFNHKTKQTTEVIGKSLSFHDLGRGKTEGETKAGMDRAHIIANEVRGSGYRSGHNLMLTSSQFNKVIMRRQEEKIGLFLDQMAQVTYSAVDAFDMKVRVERFAEGENMDKVKLVKALTDRKNALDASIQKARLKPDFDEATSSRFAEFKTIEALLKMSPEAILKLLNAEGAKTGEARIKDVIYTVTKIEFFTASDMEPNEEFNTGPDHFLGTHKA